MPNVNGAGPVDIGAYEIQLPKVINVLLDDVDPMTHTSLWAAGTISYAKLVALGRRLPDLPCRDKYHQDRVQRGVNDARHECVYAVWHAGERLKYPNYDLLRFQLRRRRTYCDAHVFSTARRRPL